MRSKENIHEIVNKLNELLSGDIVFKISLPKIVKHFVQHPSKMTECALEASRFNSYWEGVFSIYDEIENKEVLSLFSKLSEFLFSPTHSSENFLECYELLTGHRNINQIPNTPAIKHDFDFTECFIIKPDNTFTHDGDPLIWKKSEAGHFISFGNIHMGEESLNMQTAVKITSGHEASIKTDFIVNKRCLVLKPNFQHFYPNTELTPFYPVSTCNLEPIFHYDPFLTTEHDTNVAQHPFCKEGFQLEKKFNFQRKTLRETVKWDVNWQKHPHYPLWRPFIAQSNTAAFKADFGRHILNSKNLDYLQKYSILFHLNHFHCRKGYVIDTYSLYRLFHKRKLQLEQLNQLIIKQSVQQAITIVYENLKDIPQLQSCFLKRFKVLDAKPLSNQQQHLQSVLDEIAFWTGVSRHITINERDIFTIAVTYLFKTLFILHSNDNELKQTTYKNCEKYHPKIRKQRKPNTKEEDQELEVNYEDTHLIENPTSHNLRVTRSMSKKDNKKIKTQQKKREIETSPHNDDTIKPKLSAKKSRTEENLPEKIDIIPPPEIPKKKVRFFIEEPLPPSNAPNPQSSSEDEDDIEIIIVDGEVVIQKKEYTKK